jgi:hypothetical protein
VVGNDSTPFRPVFLILPFNDLFNGKTSCFTPSGIVKMDNPETPPPYVTNRVSLSQGFMFRQPGNNAVKMNRFPGFFIP